MERRGKREKGKGRKEKEEKEKRKGEGGRREFSKLFMWKWEYTSSRLYSKYGSDCAR